MSDPAAPPEPNAPAPKPDQPGRKDTAPVTIDQEGQPADNAAAAPAAEAGTQAAAGPAAGEARAPGSPSPSPGPAVAPAPAPSHSAVAMTLGLLGFLVLAGGIGYVWNQQQQVQQEQFDTAAEVQAQQQQLQTLSQQISRLQTLPAAQVPAAVKTLASQVAALQQQKSPDLSPFESRLAALEQRQPANLAPLDRQVKALRQQMTELQQLTQQINALSQQVKTLSQQVQATATRGQQADSALTQRLDTDEARMVTLEHNATQISQLTERATQLARLQAAQMALAQGQKLGDIPGAPAALARYAAEPPPTEASLRLAFPAAEQAAFDASSPDTANKPFLSRILANAEGLVTVRRGDHVLVGNATAGVLARARAALEAGDLAGAAADVASLTGPPAQAMQPWLRQARALLAARSALAELVAKA